MARADLVAQRIPGATLHRLEIARHHIEPADNDAVASVVTAFLAKLD